jgi:positive regulator of sigma E activity
MEILVLSEGRKGEPQRRRPRRQATCSPCAAPWECGVVSKEESVQSRTIARPLAEASQVNASTK